MLSLEDLYMVIEVINDTILVIFVLITLIIELIKHIQK